MNFSDVPALIAAGLVVAVVVAVLRDNMRRAGSPITRGVLGELIDLVTTLIPALRPSSPPALVRKIGRRLSQSCVTFPSGTTYAMRVLTVTLSPIDHAALLDWVETEYLIAELTQHYRKAAQVARWQWPVDNATTVVLTMDDSLRAGSVRVRGRLRSAPSPTHIPSY